MGLLVLDGVLALAEGVPQPDGLVAGARNNLGRRAERDLSGEQPVLDVRGAVQAERRRSCDTAARRALRLPAAGGLANEAQFLQSRPGLPARRRCSRSMVLRSCHHSVRRSTKRQALFAHLAVVHRESDGKDVLGVANEAAGGGAGVKVPQAEGPVPRAGEAELQERKTGMAYISSRVRRSVLRLEKDACRHTDTLQTAPEPRIKLLRSPA